MLWCIWKTARINHNNNTVQLSVETLMQWFQSTGSQLPSTLCLCILWPWPLTFGSQHLISTFMNPDTSVIKTGCNSLQWFLRHGVYKVFRMHRHTHSLMARPDYRVPSVPFFNRRGNKIQHEGRVTFLRVICRRPHPLTEVLWCWLKWSVQTAAGFVLGFQDHSVCN